MVTQYILLIFSLYCSDLVHDVETREREDRGFSVLVRLRICQTVLFYEKHVFIGPKNRTFCNNYLN